MMKTSVHLMLAGLAVGAAAVWGAGEASATSFHEPIGGVQELRTMAPLRVCQEDEPCWDCHTMGNHVCGPAVWAQEWGMGPGGHTGSAGPLRPIYLPQPGCPNPHFYFDQHGIPHVICW